MALSRDLQGQSFKKVLRKTNFKCFVSSPLDHNDAVYLAHEPWEILANVKVTALEFSWLEGASLDYLKKIP